MNALKILLGGVAGLVTFGVGSFLLFQISGIDPYAEASSGTIALMIICGAVIAFIAGYVAKLIAPAGSMIANYAVFFITSGFGAFSLVKSPGNQYTQLAATFLFGPMSILGGLMRRKFEDKR